MGVQNEAGQRLTRVLPRECTGHSKHPLPTTQEKTLNMDITRWSILKSDTREDSKPGHHQVVNTEIRLIISFAAQDGEALYNQQKTRLGADCGSDHEFLIAKFRLKLKKVGKNTRQFRYDLNQIPYNYTVEATNRFKGLDLIDRVPEELWTDIHNIV